MSIDLAKELPKLLPLAIEWVERQSAVVAQGGIGVSPRGANLAARVGVKDSSRIRLAVVDDFPLPDQDELRAAALQLELFGPAMRGITFGYSVILRRGYDADPALLAHEFRHVAQYEACGSIASFLGVHLRHLVMFGYEDSPFEVDARAHERHAV